MIKYLKNSVNGSTAEEQLVVAKAAPWACSELSSLQKRIGRNVLRVFKIIPLIASLRVYYAIFRLKFLLQYYLKFFIIFNIHHVKYVNTAKGIEFNVPRAQSLVWIKRCSADHRDTTVGFYDH
jgi:hypothetical protein